MLLLPSAAYALDAHGTSVVPSPGGDPAAPVLVWEAGAPPTGIGLTFEGARTLAVSWPTEDSPETTPLLDELLGFTVAGGARFGRVGVAASLPLWLHYAGPDGATGAPLGDLRLAVPITVWSDGDGLAVGVRAEGVAPTGAERVLLGGGWGGGVHATVGRGGDGLRWSVDAGLAGDTNARFGNVDRTLTVPLGAQVGYGRGALGAGLEAWFSPSLSATTSPLSSAPGELLARVGWRGRSGLSVTLAGGYAISPGIGSSGGRVLARVGWSAPPKRTLSTADAVTTPGPRDLVVVAQDATGAPIDATVIVEVVPPNPDTPAAIVRLGRDGTADIPLTPGDWTVTVSGPGTETQVRDIRVSEDAWRRLGVLAILQPAEGGDADLTVRLVDASGAPVEGAVVRLDGASHGETGTGGTLTLVDLVPGARTVTVDAPDYTATAPLVVTLAAEDLSRTVTLVHPPGTVKVLARTTTGPATGAQARFLGGSTGEAPTSLDLGDDGELLHQVAPGRWQVIVTAPSLGVQTRDVTVEAGQLALVIVDVQLQPDAGDASLGVRVLDPAGAPVAGAEVRLDGVSLGSTSSAGTMRVEGLAAGTRTVAVSGPLLRPSEPRTIELAGPRDLDVVLGWVPGALAVRARGPDAEPIDAAIRFAGRAEMPPGSLGPDGEALYTLPAGSWRVTLSAPALGLQERVVDVLPDGTTRIDIDASLLREAGDAALVLNVKGPDGAAVAGAHVRVDGRDAGTIGGSGGLRLEGFAPGKHRVEVEGAAEALGTWSRELLLRSGDNLSDITLGWAPRAVRVRAKGPEGPATDAVARAYGPGYSPPVPVDSDATARFVLSAQPGWAIAASSPRWGLTSAQVPALSSMITAKDKYVPTDVDLVFTPPTPGVASLLVELHDPDGSLVRGGSVRLGETTMSAPSGILLVPTLPLGPLAVRTEVPGYAEAATDLTLVEGAQERRLRLDWLPRPLHIRVAEPDGTPVDAEVRLSGPVSSGTAYTRPGATGADGALETSVLPGAWQVIVSAPAYGARSVEAPVAAGVGPVEVVVVLDAARVSVTAGAVTLDESLHFAFDEAILQPDSFRVLEEVTAVLTLHPEVTRIEIEGHTDDRGDPVYNLDLSQRRAEAVRAWLVAHGVEAGRLVAKGYGATRPIAKNTSEAGRRTNRRVQLVIVGRAEAAAE
ncbi:MAG: OmpA family protein [Myxococcota bacterium]